MSSNNTPSTIEKTARRVWKSAQMFIAFHKDQDKRHREEPKFWPPKNGNASIHGDPANQEALVVVKSADPEKSQDVQIKLHPGRIVVRRDADVWWQGVAVDEHSVTVRMADNTIIEVRHDGSVKRRSAEDETHVEADGSIFKWTEHAEAHMTGDGVELTRRTEDRIAAITADGVVDRSRKR
ncbi:hypothetical protein [Phaeobacter inhibens]|uniref:hypothetical protein n=1 Tax=Phaeobacter inhibens TaxID=221822 RepID=UPI0009717D4A|nr:hypothetical protein [Phaeobacter inhibens]APX18110.1 hypothetical protein BWR17_19725 [Phaeobacter inhibens]UWR62791.1 hypothetical protein K4F88_19420 [Phaeobacter inhibens]